MILPVVLYFVTFVDAPDRTRGKVQSQSGEIRNGSRLMINKHENRREPDRPPLNKNLTGLVSAVDLGQLKMVIMVMAQSDSRRCSQEVSGGLSLARRAVVGEEAVEEFILSARQNFVSFHLDILRAGI